MNAQTETCIAELRAWMGERLSTAVAVREQHGRDTTFHPVMPPDAVAYPSTVDEVRRIVATCALPVAFRSFHSAPVRPARGTSLPCAAASAWTRAASIAFERSTRPTWTPRWRLA